MQVSYQWLKDYVKLPDSVSPESVAEKLKLSTVEVENVVDFGKQLENVVVGQILKIDKHPNADKLKVCEVDLGTEKTTIVCGGSNLQEKMLVAVAKLGAQVRWHGEGEPITLEKATIRGVESSGMICGSDEIGLIDVFPKKEEKEIVDLTHLKVKPGKALAEALKLNDFVFEIDNKSLSNRPDLWGHYGLAREVAAVMSRSVTPYKTTPIKDGSGVKLQVEVEDEKGCPRYMAVAVGNVTVAESPAWIKQRLLAAGVRPINNVVDVTNYVMLDLGQPLHAFDARLLSNKADDANIVVRRAKENEKFTTLDEKERQLDASMLVIATPEKAVALAGVMGGQNSGIQNDTTVVVFEAANFDAAMIRKTSMRLGLRTDASARFEKSLDPSLCETALAAAVKLLLELSPKATVTSKVVDVYEKRALSRPIELPPHFVSNTIGLDIPGKTVTMILDRLGFEVKSTKPGLSVTVPSWRAHDVNSPEAVVEEVLRIYGYHNVKGSLPTFTITPPETNVLRNLERDVADTLVKEFAFTEVYNYSFVSEDQIRRLGDDPAQYLELDNPLSKEQPFLRRNLLPNLLETVAKGSAGRDHLKVFEYGQVYKSEKPGLRVSAQGDDLLPRQDTLVTMVCFDKSDNVFRRTQEALGGVTRRLSYPLELRELEDKCPWMHPGRSAGIFCGEVKVGGIFELHPKVLKNYGLEGRASIASLNLAVLAENSSSREPGRFEPLAAYPEVERDVAFVIDKGISNAEIMNVLASVDPLLKSAVIFDSYEGSSVGDGKKSVAYHLTYAADRTLTSEEVEKAEQKLREILKSKWQVEFR